MRYEVKEKIKIGVIVTTAAALLGYGGYVVVGSISGQIGSNHEVIELKKNFNVIIEQTPNAVSVVKVANFTDYQGNTVEFETCDGLRVITSIEDGTLSNKSSYEKAVKLAETQAKGKEYGVMCYDKLQGNDLTLTKGTWNKKLHSFDYSFDKAIEITDDGTVIVYDVQSWKDWSEDEKVQFVTFDDEPILRTYKHIKLVDTRNAAEGAFDNYVLSLAGSPEKIVNYEDIVSSKSNNQVKAKTLSMM
jgi:hypothetical protein